MDKVAFSIGGFSVHWYGILAASGFLAGLWTASRRAPRHGLARETIADLGPWLIVGTLVGARLWFVMSYWHEEFVGQPLWQVVNVRAGGLVFYGGLAGAALAGVVFARLRRLPLWELADALAPSIALGHALGRVGCFINGCCYGLPTDLPWAVHYAGDPATQGAGLHPTQLYEAALLLALYAALAWQYRTKRFSGHTFALYLLGYGAIRFSVEFLRGDYGASCARGLETRPGVQRGRLRGRSLVVRRPKPVPNGPSETWCLNGSRPSWWRPPDRGCGWMPSSASAFPGSPGSTCNA